MPVMPAEIAWIFSISVAGSFLKKTASILYTVGEVL